MDRQTFINNYDRVRQARSPEKQAEALRLCGYATDPNYANALIQIIRSYNLNKYDEEVEQVLEQLNQLQEQVTNLQSKVSQLEQQASIEAPEWAADAVKQAVVFEIIDTPDNGSFDFYRCLTVMYRKGLL